MCEPREKRRSRVRVHTVIEEMLNFDYQYLIFILLLRKRGECIQLFKGATYISHNQPDKYSYSIFVNVHLNIWFIEVCFYECCHSCFLANNININNKRGCGLLVFIFLSASNYQWSSEGECSLAVLGVMVRAYLQHHKDVMV